MFSRCIILVSVTCCLVAQFGCSSSQSNADSKQGEKRVAEELDAEAVFRRMLSTYREAKSYSDEGRIEISFYEHGQQRNQSARMQVAWQDPGKFAISAYQLQVVCDEQNLKAIVDDEATNNLDSQMIVRQAPKGEKSAIIQSLLSDNVMNRLLLDGIGGWPAQLELLFADEPMKSLASGEFKKSLEADESVEGHSCYRIKVASDKQRWVLWVDKESFLLRKLQYPESEFLPALVTSPNASSVKLTATFHSAQVGSDVSDETFQLERGAKHQVLFFVVPPQPAATDVVGKSVQGKFHFESPDGKKFGSEQLKSNVKMLVWFSKDPVARPYLLQLQETVRPFLENGVSLVGICTEPKRFSNDDLKSLMEKWELKFDVVRDYEAFGRDVFGVKVVPTLAILDRDGVVQAFEERANPNLAQQLPTILRQLVGGHNLAAEIKQLADQQQREYEHNLAIAKGEKPAPSAAAKIEPASQPTRSKLTTLWSQAIKGAGNVYAGVGDSLVLTESNEVITFDGQGNPGAPKTIAKQGEKLSRLRTVTTKDGKKYYVAWAFGGPRAYVYDNEFKLLYQYPEQVEHQGINDCLIDDLDNDGEIEVYVGFWGVGGVHQVDLAGMRKWGNRTVRDVFQLCVSPPNPIGWRKLMVTGQSGVVYRLNQYGNADSPESVSGRAIHHLYSARKADPSRAVYCGISLTAQGQAVGINEKLREIWRVPLPAGVFQRDVEFMKFAASKNGQGYWVIAGPSGAITLVREDGNFSDSWNTGHAIHGIAAQFVGSEIRVIVSHEKGVTAHSVRPKDE